MSNDLIITPQSQLEVSEDSISRFVNYYLNHLDIRKALFFRGDNNFVSSLEIFLHLS